MKKLVVLGLFLFPIASFAAPTSQPADYDIPVHVTQSKLVLQCSSGLCNYFAHLEGTIAGKKVELVETRLRMAVLHTGDYKARVVKSGVGKTCLLYTSLSGSFANGIPEYRDQ